MEIIAKIYNDFPTKFAVPRQSGLVDAPSTIVFEKEYRVKLSSEVSDVIIEKISKGGLDIGGDRPTKPCRVIRLSGDELTVILTEGMNRQIRRVFELFGLSVIRLCRVRFMNITSEGLRPGDYRELTGKELKIMKEMAGK